MSRSQTGSVVLGIVIIGSAQLALAHDRWGTAEQATTCAKEAAESANGGGAYKYSEALKQGHVSAACQAEVEKRSAQCLKDPAMKYSLNDRSVTKGDDAGYCTKQAFGTITDQIVNAGLAKEREAAAAKVAEEAKAKQAADTAAVELPKAELHDAKLEKAVAAAYDKDYPGNKVLKVVLGSWSTDYEKDAFGRITGRDLDATVVNKQPDGKCQLHSELWMQRGSGKSFSGPLSARGAGSMSKKEILCSKVDAGAAAASKTRK